MAGGSDVSAFLGHFRGGYSIISVHQIPINLSHALHLQVCCAPQSRCIAEENLLQSFCICKELVFKEQHVTVLTLAARPCPQC